MIEWKEIKLADACTKIGSGATPRGGGEAYKENGISLIRSQNVLDFKFSYNGLAFIDNEQANDLKNVIVHENDVLLNITGDSVARVCKVPKNVLPARVNQHVAIIRSNVKQLDSNFLLYQLIKLKEHLLSISEIGATRRAITKGMIESLEIPLPSLTEQTAIASVLTSLDNKIGLLHRQNATLEKMAETLFRQWFVEREGLNYDLLDTYDDRELKNQGNQANQKNYSSDKVEGMKEEWKMGKISDYATHYKESVQPGKNRSTLYAHYSIPSFDNGKYPVKELGGEIQSNKYKIPYNCILFSKLNPHKDKRVWLLQDEVESNGICSTEFQVVLPNRRKHLYFLYGWLTQNENYNEIASGIGGTSGSHQRIDPSIIYEFQCPIVPENIIEAYNNQIEPIFKKQVINQTQIRTLTALRDTLLPKLMSGEVKVEL